MHETGRAANHFGHHQHNITSDELTLTAKDKSDPSKKTTTHDTHCVSHAHLAVVMPDMSSPLSTMDNSGSRVVVKLVVPASAFAPPPERPQWSSRA